MVSACACPVACSGLGSPSHSLACVCHLPKSGCSAWWWASGVAYLAISLSIVALCGSDTAWARTTVGATRSNDKRPADSVELERMSVSLAGVGAGDGVARVAGAVDVGDEAVDHFRRRQHARQTRAGMGAGADQVKAVHFFRSVVKAKIGRLP